MRFTKMQGAGNDYIYIDCFKEKIEDHAGLAKKLSDRHFGIGGDGVIYICPSETADFKMDLYNADGSHARMCGNGIRCLGKYVYERGLTDKLEISVETPSGIKQLSLNLAQGKVVSVSVDMGEPVLEPEQIPVKAEGDSAVKMPLRVSGGEYEVTCVSMGTPHAVVFMDEIDYLVLPQLGPKFENHQAFPQRTNTEFVEVVDCANIKMRTWERGSGETLASGTGACAAVVAGVLTNQCGREVTVKVRGGELFIHWDEKTGHVMMTGDCVEIFEGEMN